MAAHEVRCRNEAVKLSPKEAHLLEYFMRNKNMTLSKEQIFDKIWGFEQDAELNNVELYVFYLRKKISFVQNGVALDTIRGLGYRLSEAEA